MGVIERKTRYQRTFERDSGGSKPYSLVATNSCGTRKTERCIGEARHTMSVKRIDTDGQKSESLPLLIMQPFIMAIALRLLD